MQNDTTKRENTKSSPLLRNKKGSATRRRPFKRNKEIMRCNQEVSPGNLPDVLQLSKGGGSNTLLTPRGK